MGLKDELVLSNDPKDEGEEEEEEEEEDLVDPHDGIRENCQEESHCQKHKDALQACTERVENAAEGNTETCHMELMDFVHCVDGCLCSLKFCRLCAECLRNAFMFHHDIAHGGFFSIAKTLFKHLK